jgi:hypothetical protein
VNLIFIFVVFYLMTCYSQVSTGGLSLKAQKNTKFDGKVSVALGAFPFKPFLLIPISAQRFSISPLLALCYVPLR